MIADNVRRIRENIEKASLHTGENVTLVGVTKTRTVEEIKELVKCGVTTLGENRVQEYRDKEPLIEGDVTWHIIGSLQTNKLKYIIGKVGLIQSVDSFELASAISDMSVRRDVVTDYLMEVNISGEESKHGFSGSEIAENIEKMSALPNVRVKGLMMMAPNTDDEKYLAALFEKTRKIYDNLVNYNAKYDNISIELLSMGMSHDYEIAVRSGANMVRIGTSLFV